jgi:hypothetical protein
LHAGATRRRAHREASEPLKVAERRRTGKDPRIVTFRSALDALLEALDATVRIARWHDVGEEAIPESLQQSAAQLAQRLGVATRLAAGKFVGGPAVVATSDDIRVAVQALDAAHLAYCKKSTGSPAEREEAVNTLDAELGRVKLNAGRWE